MLRLIRQWIIDTLGFTRSEANGTLILILILLLTVIIPRLFLLSTNNLDKRFTADQDKLDQWAKQIEESLIKKEKTTSFTEKKEFERFTFNPNLTNKEDLQRLGFTSKSAYNITSYRSKGGSFEIKKDLRKIYGIDQELVTSLWSFIDLPEEIEVSETDKPSFERPKEEVTKFDLNHADAQTFQKIRGIGPVLSERIVKFRNRLGGFYTTEQLHDVYGLDSLVIEKIIDQSYIETEHLVKINLNTDSLKHLYQHPYIDYNLAKAIYNYRVQRGQLDSVAQIKSIKILNDSIYKKIYPYLSLNP